MNRAKGLIAIVPFFFGVTIGGVFTWSASSVAGLIYSFGSMACIYLIVAAYCAKCPCRNGFCTHVVLGPLTRFVPRRRQGPYGFWDYTAVVAAFLYMMVFPQTWLARDVRWLVVFWALMTATILLIVFYACPICRNKRCGIRKLVVRNESGPEVGQDAAGKDLSGQS